MIIVIQLLVSLLILLSTILVISIPVVLALPGKWEQAKNAIYTGTGVWAGLVVITGIVNTLST